MAPISGFIIFSLIITLGYFVGLLTFIVDYEDNKCDMTFMFEYPQFVKIDVKDDLYYKKYGLYAYSEGRFTVRAREMHFDGIPVLFIPGNAGSYKQVRSFASISLRKGLNDRPGYHFDFFTVDLNDELSGLNGALLTEQMEHVNNSIAQILMLYKDCKSPVQSLVIIAHSMGGIIARGLLATLPQNSSIIPLIITLATPHLRPPIALDIYMSNFYHKMQEAKDLPSNSTIISISGGYNDFMVSPVITQAKDVENLHVVTTAVPLVWLSVDHQCILWCKQLVLAVTRSLFELVDRDTKQITGDLQYRRQVFQHHLVHHSGTKVRQAHQYKRSLKLDHMNYWLENSQRKYMVSLPHGTEHMQWHIIKIANTSNHEYLTIVALNLEVVDWVFACKASKGPNGTTGRCSNAVHLSHLSEIAPSIRHKTRVLHLNLDELKSNHSQATHVGVRLLKTDEPIIFHVDMYNLNRRQIEVDVPRWWTTRRQTIIPKTHVNALYYELVLPQLQHVIQFYQLFVEPIKCKNNLHHASATLNIPWANHNVHKYITEDDKKPLDVRLYTSRPNRLNSSIVTIKLSLDPICIYSISMEHSLVGMLGQFTRTYTSLLIANIGAVVLLAFRTQLSSIDMTGSCSVIFNAIKHGVKPYYILTLVKLASRGLSWKGFTNILPPPDWQLLSDEGSDFFLLPLILYVCSVGIVWIIAIVLIAALVLCESTVSKIVSKFFGRFAARTIGFSDSVMGIFHKLPGVVATFLVVLSIITCGALSLCVGCVLYFLKLTQMSQDYVETLVVQAVKYLSKMLKKQNRPTEADLPNNRPVRRRRNNADRRDNQSRRKNKSEIKISSNSDLENEDEKKLKTDLLKQDEIETKPENATPVDNENECQKLSTDEKVEPAGDPDAYYVGEPAPHSVIFFHLSIFLLWCIVAGLNIPSVLTWAHNFKYKTVLQPDPSFVPGIILSLCAIPLWQMDLPKPNISMYPQLGLILNILAAISLIYAPLSVYRLVYIITTAIVLITVHQLLAPEKIEEEMIPDSPDHADSSDHETFLDKVKAKWE